MSLARLLFSEIRFRWVNFLVSAAAIALASVLFALGPAIVRGYADATEEQLDAMKSDADKRLKELDKATKRIMRDLGVNLRIVHRDTSMGALYTEFVAHDFPEDYVDRLANAEQIETIVHLVATLQERIEWENRKIFLVGMKPVVTNSQKNEEKPHMVKPVPKGKVLVGYELGLGRKAGETIEIRGKSFEIAQILPEFGEQRDVQLVLDLEDAQAVLEKPDRINQIMALNCKCKGDRISVVRKELEGVLPETKVTEYKTRASAREAQRDRVSEAAKREREMLAENRSTTQRWITLLLSLLTPGMVVCAVVIVGLLAWLNVRERQSEIGVLRAIGKSGLQLAFLLLSRLMLTGLLGGLLGLAACYIVLSVAPALIAEPSLDIPWDRIRPGADLVVLTVALAPIVSLVAGYFPVLLALRRDPAAALME